MTHLGVVVLFMRATKTGTAPDGSRQITHRLVPSRRAGDTVRQTTLLNPGRNFAVPREMWPSVCRRIEEVLSGAGLAFGPGTLAKGECPRGAS